MNVPLRYRRKFARPWAVSPRPWRSPFFKRWLRSKGLLAPHYRLSEARCHDAAGTPVPRRMRPRAQAHAFRLEQLRHANGDRPFPITSWYRTPAHNAAVGGASASKHMKAIATDHPAGSFQDSDADRIFANHGFGQYPSGARHVDSRAGRARWTSY